MAKYIMIDRGNGTATAIICKTETANEDPLTETEILINELYNKCNSLDIRELLISYELQHSPQPAQRRYSDEAIRRVDEYLKK